jgi:hypothetical protein
MFFRIEGNQITRTAQDIRVEFLENGIIVARRSRDMLTD